MTADRRSAANRTRRAGSNHRRRPRRRRQRSPLLLVTLAAVAVLAVVSFLSSGDTDEGAIDTAPVTVGGDYLPVFTGSADDPAVGRPAPTLEGLGRDGSPVVIDPSEGPMGILLVAHWCPHCQDEVREFSAWLEENDLPEGFRLVAVSTSTDPALPNYPPSRWLDREGWTVPTLMDDPNDRAAVAYGMRGTPFWVFVDRDGTVVGRIAGRIAVDRVVEIATQLTEEG